MASEVSKVSCGAFHRSTWKELNTQEGFNKLETWLRLGNPTQDLLQGIYNFVARFGLKGNESLLGNLSVHKAANQKQAVEQDLIQIANLQLSIYHCTVAGIMRSTCEAMVQEGELTLVQKGELQTMAQFLLSDLFKGSEDIQTEAKALNAALVGENKQEIQDSLQKLIARFKEGWVGATLKHVPVLNWWYY